MTWHGSGMRRSCRATFQIDPDSARISSGRGCPGLRGLLRASVHSRDWAVVTGVHTLASLCGTSICACAQLCHTSGDQRCMLKLLVAILCMEQSILQKSWRELHKHTRSVPASPYSTSIKEAKELHTTFGEKLQCNQDVRGGSQANI